MDCIARPVHRALRQVDEPVGYAWVMRVPLSVATRFAVCCVAAVALAGCGAGQITQTDSQVAAVDGAFGNVGRAIALREVLIPYPLSQRGTYPSGSTVPVLVTIINQGDRTDELIGVASPAASQVVVEGTTQVPPGTTVNSTAGPAGDASPLVVGQLRILLTTAQPLRAGLTTPVTFQFRDAGKITLPVPMAVPPNSAG
jgi:copper(I)-binding protein